MGRATMKNKKHEHRNHHRPAPDDGDAFIPDVVRKQGRLVDDEAEALAEELIVGATSAEFIGEDARDEWVTDEVGGPFIEIAIDEEELRAVRKLDKAIKRARADEPTRKAG